ncbi:AraC family transcriptional regulator [Paenibacillus sp. HB172176]|uniref:AraC family transcriptional regulator n=1 Tax=Paenibacillus sp. HB172176 TaxID=2493690 RepID=UPI00143B57A9|nr:AraC family transcriptional regulator [Paenibacillus sp. HB172176]
MLASRYVTIGYVHAGPQPSFRFAEQTLDHDALIAVEQGGFEYEIGEETGSAAFGDLVFCPAETCFKRRATSEIMFHHIHLGRSEEDDSAESLPSGKVSIGDVNRLASTLRYLRELYHGDYPEAMRRKAIYGQYVPELLWLCELESYQADLRTQRNDPIMEQALRELHLHAFEPISAGQVAAKLKLHPSLFSRRFKEAYGVSPVSYVTRLRLEEAKRLLLETDEKLEWIADRCGYESGSYFCRVFSSKVGMNPSAFRLSYRL